MPAEIYVLAGVNGAGKSSIGGAALQAGKVDYFNPDLVARELQTASRGLTLEAANGRAWSLGRQMLERALAGGGTYAFETTLGASTITQMLLDGARNGAQVHVWFAGLASAELHIERVRERVLAGGHPIDDDKIKARFQSSRVNILKLMPHLASLRVYDNSAAADPKKGKAPKPLLLLHMTAGKVVHHLPLPRIPDWAKPLLAAALG